MNSVHLPGFLMPGHIRGWVVMNVWDVVIVEGSYCDFHDYLVDLLRKTVKYVIFQYMTFLFCRLL